MFQSGTLKSVLCCVPVAFSQRRIPCLRFKPVPSRHSCFVRLPHFSVLQAARRRNPIPTQLKMFRSHRRKLWRKRPTLKLKMMDCQHKRRRRIAFASWPMIQANPIAATTAAQTRHRFVPMKRMTESHREKLPNSVLLCRTICRQTFVENSSRLSCKMNRYSASRHITRTM